MSATAESMASSSAGNSRVFVYCPDTASTDVRGYFKKKGYVCFPLNDKPAHFWELINIVSDGGVLVLLSHGDKNGPLMVAGTDGDDMTKTEVEKLGSTLAGKKVALYLLSCQTGAGEFCKTLKSTAVKFIAPIGYADVRETSVTLSVLSTNGEKDGYKTQYLGWEGNGIDPPNRINKALLIP